MKTRDASLSLAVNTQQLTLFTIRNGTEAKEVTPDFLESFFFSYWSKRTRRSSLCPSHGPRKALILLNCH